MHCCCQKLAQPYPLTNIQLILEMKMRFETFETSAKVVQWSSKRHIRCFWRKNTKRSTVLNHTYLKCKLISFDFFQHILGNYFCYIIKLDVLTCMNMDPMTLPLCMEKELVPTRSPPLGFRQNPVSMEKKQSIAIGSFRQIINLASLELCVIKRYDLDKPF